ncbi:MAG: ABC transporter substrate-binding protein, partial [Aristaeellaceae bacterium]
LEPYFRAAGIKCTFKDSDRSNIDNDLMANAVQVMLLPVTNIGDISIILKPNSMVPGYATNVAWYGTMDETTATGDLLKLIELKKQLDVTSSTEERTAIALQMLKLHEENQWTLAFVEAAPAYHAVNARIQNFLADGVWSDIYRDYGIAHCQCWYIAE